MKVMIISDTHYPKKAKAIPKQVLRDLTNCDLLIHAGDWNTLDVFHELSRYTEVKGVFGNTDSQEIKDNFPETLLLHLNGFNIGVIHGHGEKSTTEKRALRAFDSKQVDCIIYGHSHIPQLKKAESILLINPGSATDKRRQPYFSYCILTIEDSLGVNHIFYDDKS
ncbi:metallophosphoesterase family protein [Bacillus solitudinis]|uniref:metallophosphoesterase family protein n=1 Tax=Bacillus solitudinis TaxID=2014074 RepID=UPI000C23BBD1|nr:metallophosphoesterase family protein [Bacillus solitudinis]